MAQGYGQIAGHAEHHKFKAKHHEAMAALHTKAAAHHTKMAGGAEEPDGDEGMGEEQAEPMNTSPRLPMSFGRGAR